MLVSVSWLKDFVPYAGSIEELCFALTSRGLEVEGVTVPFEYLKTVLIGEVLSCEKHPNSDTLSLCSVTVGHQIIAIVCGAKNIQAGIRVPVALLGTTMPNGLVIQEAELRGVRSCGMICSKEELHLGSDNSGIWVLPQDAPIGVNLMEYLAIDDTIIELSVTPNRADCLSILGVAREVALYFSLPLTLPESTYVVHPEYNETVTAVVEGALSSLYTVHVLNNILLVETPRYIQQRLMSVGIRPTSLIVDITNYVMIELGQPLHAFDAEALVGNTLTVATAGEQDLCVTLDSQERVLNANDIVIRDENGIVAIAGILGGQRAEVTVHTKKIVLESAVFDAISVRKTAKRLGINSQAGYRFERGVDRGLVEYALARAVYLLSITTKVEISSVIMKAEEECHSPTILFRPDKARELLGITLSDDAIRTMILALECEIEECNFFWKIVPPSYRLDITQEVDFIEEIARIYGMDEIPAILPAIHKNMNLESLSLGYTQTMATKRHMLQEGLQEVITYSFVPKSLLDELLLQKNRVYLQNPLSEEYNVLRTHLFPSMMQVFQRNSNRGEPSVALFEVGTIFLSSADNTETHVEEIEMLGILVHGDKNPQEWGYADECWEYRDVKGILTRYIVECIGVDCTYAEDTSSSFLSPSVGIFVQGEKIGSIGRVEPKISDAFDAKKDIWYAEISLSRLYSYKKAMQTKFIPFSSLPSISRDITFIFTDATKKIGTLFEIVKTIEMPLLHSTTCIDIYTPEESTEKHVTIRIVLQDEQRTLTDKEADIQRDMLVQYVKKHLPVRV